MGEGFTIICNNCGKKTNIEKYEDMYGAGRLDEIEVIETMSHGIAIQCTCSNLISDFN